MAEDPTFLSFSYRVWMKSSFYSKDKNKVLTESYGPSTKMWVVSYSKVRFY